jgi:oligopeptide transport system substrate-binding protein
MLQEINGQRAARWTILLIATLAILLSGCAPAWPFPQPTPDPKLPDAQQIFKPLEIGPNAGDLATLDPASIAFGVDYGVAQLIFPQLVTLDGQLRPVDWAVERHEVSEDGLTYTFHVRKGLTWSDGAPIDAQTFAYSINRTLDPCTRSHADVEFYLYDIKGAQPFHEAPCPAGATSSAATLIGSSLLVPDSLTLQITLNHPAGSFLSALTYSTSWAAPKQLIDHYGARWTDHLADGSGFGGNLFKLTTWQHPGQSSANLGTPAVGASPTPVLPDDTRGYLIFTRNERFWGQKPYLKEVHYWLFQNPSTAWETYKAGEGDANPAVIAQELDIAKTLKGSTYKQIPQLAFSYLWPNWKLAPFDDVRVRQAFSLALDRQAIAHDILKETAQPTIHLMPEGLPGYNPDLTDAAGRKGKDALKPDLETARKLANEYAAEKCGGDFSRCAPLVFTVTQNRPTTALVAQEMQRAWQSAFPGWSITMGCSMHCPQIKSVSLMLTIAGWGADYPDPQDFTSLL